MTIHSEQRVMPFRPEQLFDLVADVQRYPEFLPWCVGARIRSSDGQLVVADLMIGYKIVRERFTSKVNLDRDASRIDVEYADGPFKYLTNHWIFEPVEGQGGDCLIDFYVDFEFKSRFFQAAIGPVFNEAVKRMIRAFEKRADALYGNP